jgi:hypothetical protein
MDLDDYSSYPTPKKPFDSYSAFIIEVEIESLNEKHWYRFKVGSRYIIDHIAYQELIRYLNANIKIINDIYSSSGYIDNTKIEYDFRMLRTTSNDNNKIKGIETQIYFIQDQLFMKSKKKVCEE